MSVPLNICLLVLALPAFRLRVEEQMHAFKAFKCSTNCCFFHFDDQPCPTHCHGGAGKDGQRLHLSNSCSLSVPAAP